MRAPYVTRSGPSVDLITGIQLRVNNHEVALTVAEAARLVGELTAALADVASTNLRQTMKNVQHHYQD